MIAVVFPGQGSQKPGMGRELANSFSEAKAVYNAVSDSIGVDVENLSWESDEETLRLTQNAQIALFTAGLAAYEALRSRVRVPPAAVAGHSVGEFCALVVAGIYSLEDAAKLVKARGQAMAEAGKETRGAMAAVLGLDRTPLEEICAQTAGVVAIANDNSPGQIVISGDKEAVAAAGAAASEAGAKRVIPLNVSGAFHSPLMADPARKMRAEFDRYSVRDAAIPIYSNVTSEPVKVGQEWPGLLERQLMSPVRWTETVQHMTRDGVTTMIECGVGDVLSGLIRRTEKSLVCLSVQDVASLEKTVNALSENPEYS